MFHFILILVIGYQKIKKKKQLISSIIPESSYPSIGILVRHYYVFHERNQPTQRAKKSHEIKTNVLIYKFMYYGGIKYITHKIKIIYVTWQSRTKVVCLRGILGMVDYQISFSFFSLSLSAVSRFRVIGFVQASAEGKLSFQTTFVFLFKVDTVN